MFLVLIKKKYLHAIKSVIEEFRCKSL